MADKISTSTIAKNRLVIRRQKRSMSVIAISTGVCWYEMQEGADELKTPHALNLAGVIDFSNERHRAKTAQRSAAPKEGATSSCPVTLPRKSPLRDFGGSNVHWEGDLFVAGLPLDGAIAFRPETVRPDGSLPQKFGWYRGAGLRGKLIIAGKRLDAPAPPLRTDFSDYGDTGFLPSTLIFPTEGCWEVTGKVNQTILTFVMRVVKLQANAVLPES